MELFNIDGTTKSSFTIGTGTEQIEFRSFDGKFYYRNYGETWKEVAGAGGKIRPWQTNSAFEAGEFVSYNGILWVVISNHNSGLLFDSESGKMGRLGVYDEVTIFNLATSLTHQISTSSSNKIFIQGSVVTPGNILLPDATKFQSGISFEIQNDSTISVLLKYNDGSIFKEIKSGSLMFVTLLSNTTTKGTWTTYDFTVESGLSVVSTKSVNYVAGSNEIIPCNTSVVPISITLPVAPSNGDSVAIMDVRGSFGQNPVTILRNDKKIQDISEDWKIDIANTYIELFYISSRNSWFFKEVPNGSAGITPYDIYNNIAPQQAPVLNNYSVVPNVFEIGQTISTTNSVVFSLNTSSGTDPITAITITKTDSAEVIGNLTVTNPLGGDETFTYAPINSIGASANYKAIITDNNLTDEATISIKFLPKHYWGFSTATSLTSATVATLPSALRETLEPFVFGTNILNDAYVYLVVPATFSFTAIEDVSNSSIYPATGFTVSTLNITNGFGITIPYRVIRSNNKTYAGGFTWKIL